MADQLIDSEYGTLADPETQVLPTWQEGPTSASDCESVDLECLSSSDLPGLKTEATICMVLRHSLEGWTAEVDDAGIVEFGTTKEVARSSVIETILSLRAVYLDESDESLTQDAIELRDWLRRIF